MTKFTKRPVEIEAVRLTERTKVRTREGTLWGEAGDWLITGVEGEVYPCGHAIFMKTYYPSGCDKCQYCKHRDTHALGRAPCDYHEVCMFDWRDGI